MADFGHARPLAAKNLPVDHQAAADAGADRHIENDALVAAGAEAGFGQCGRVAIVFNPGGQPEFLLAPRDPVRSRPSRRSDGS